MTARQQVADGFYRHLREWFTAFLPRQGGAAPNTITSCRHTWNMLLGYAEMKWRVNHPAASLATCSGGPGSPGRRAAPGMTASSPSQLSC